MDEGVFFQNKRKREFLIMATMRHVSVNVQKFSLPNMKSSMRDAISLILLLLYFAPSLTE